MESLRERKKQLVRRAILDTAELLFEERGYDAVTVAEIADAANVSVKTLFVYFRSKEDLAFADTSLIDALSGAVRDRPAGTTPALAVGAALRAMVEQEEDGRGLEGYHRLVGDSAALRSRLLRLWSEYEDTLVETLAGGREPTPRIRLQAAQLIAVVRSLTSPEVRQAVAADPHTLLLAWIDEATALISAE